MKDQSLSYPSWFKVSIPFLIISLYDLESWKCRQLLLLLTQSLNPNILASRHSVPALPQDQHRHVDQPIGRSPEGYSNGGGTDLQDRLRPEYGHVVVDMARVYPATASCCLGSGAGRALPILSLLGVLYLTLRLIYTVYQDFSRMLRISPISLAGLLLGLYLFRLWILLLGYLGMGYLLRYLFLRFRYIFGSMFSTTYQRLPTSVRAVFQTLSRWFLGLPGFLYPLFCSLSRSLKRFGRVYQWLLVAYAAWLGFTYTASFIFYHHQDALSTVVCATPYVPSQLVLCQPPGPSTPDLLVGITLPRGGLADAMRRVGQGHSPAHQISDRQISKALVALSAHVETSQLSGKDKVEFGKGFRPLIEEPDTAAQYVTSYHPICTY